MQFPQIRLQSQNSILEMTTQKGQLSIEQPKAKLDLQQPPAEMTINRTPSKLSIDQSKAREDMDLKNISKRIEEFAQRGYEDWLAGLARVSQDGDELMMIENGGDVIAAQAKRNSEPPIYEFNIGWIPSAESVKIGYQPADLDIQWKANKPINNTLVQKPIVDYQPGRTNFSMKQYARLNIDFENLKHVGINYEQQI